jgi:hypothetical protein
MEETLLINHFNNIAEFAKLNDINSLDEKLTQPLKGVYGSN